MTISLFHAGFPSYILLHKRWDMTNIKKKFGAHLFQLRKQSGLTQATLAAKTELSVDLISRIERGERAPSLESIEKLSNSLKISLSELFNFDGQEIAVLSENPFESMELWKLIQGKRPKQVKKLTKIAKILLE